MNAMTRPVRFGHAAITICSLMLSFERGSGEDAAAPRKVAAEASAQSSASPQMRKIHPQIRRSSLARDYRSTPIQSASLSARAAAERIREALNRDVDQTQWEFTETPLRDVLHVVRDVLDVPMAIDFKAFEDAGVDSEAPVTFAAQAPSARAALRQVLDPFDLTWTVRDECLLITTKDRAAESLTQRLYPIPCGVTVASSSLDFVSLIDLVMNTIEPTTWNVVGGSGAIMILAEPPMLVVSQTEEVHDKIEALLGTLHAKGGVEFGFAEDGSDPGSPIVRLHPVADAETRASLAKQLVELCNASLAEKADAQAQVTPVGGCVVVRSKSPEFHILAEQLIHGVAGVEVRERSGTGDANAGATPGAAIMGGIGGGMF